MADEKTPPHDCTDPPICCALAQREGRAAAEIFDAAEVVRAAMVAYSRLGTGPPLEKLVSEARRAADEADHAEVTTAVQATREKMLALGPEQIADAVMANMPTDRGPDRATGVDWVRIDVFREAVVMAVLMANAQQESDDPATVSADVTAEIAAEVEGTGMAPNALAAELRESAEKAKAAATAAPGPLAAAPHRAMARTADALAQEAEDAMRVIIYRSADQRTDNIQITHGPLSPDAASQMVADLRASGMSNARIAVVPFRPPADAPTRAAAQADSERSFTRPRGRATRIVIEWSDGMRHEWTEDFVRDGMWKLELTSPEIGEQHISGYYREDMERVIGTALANTKRKV
jgi:hypothetical protein